MVAASPSVWQCVAMRLTLLSIQFYKGEDDHNGGGDHDHDGDHDDYLDDDDKKRYNNNMSILLKSRSIGFSGVFWVYSAASLVMALYAYLVTITLLCFFSDFLDPHFFGSKSRSPWCRSK